jgi:hypothetical protein
MKAKEKTCFRMTMLSCFFFLVAGLGASIGAEENQKKEIKRMVFEATTIEGQMGTIKALIVTSDKRPEFSPMALQLTQSNFGLNNVNSKILDEGWYREAFFVKLPK